MEHTTLQKRLWQTPAIQAILNTREEQAKDLLNTLYEYFSANPFGTYEIKMEYSKELRDTVSVQWGALGRTQLYRIMSDEGLSVNMDSTSVIRVILFIPARQTEETRSIKLTRTKQSL